jgi:hypothetical protein
MSDDPSRPNLEQIMLDGLLTSEPATLIAKLTAEPARPARILRIRTAALINKYGDQFPPDVLAAAHAVLQRYNCSTEIGAELPDFGSIDLDAVEPAGDRP